MNEKCFCHIGMADGTRYKVKDADARSSIESINNNIVSLNSEIDEVHDLIETLYVTPEQYGAVGDGINDDTSALQLFLNDIKDKNIIGYMSKHYKITSSLLIEGENKILNAQGSIIQYNGNDSAIKINNAQHYELNFGTILAGNGNGIEFYTKDSATWETSGWSQYVNLTFEKIRSFDKCIYFNRSNANTGWMNEIRISKGKLESGNYGIWADSKDSSFDTSHISQITIDKVGFEGVTTGLYMANGCNHWSIINCRYAESFDYLIETIGRCNYCKFYGTNELNMEKMKLSNQTSYFKIDSHFITAQYNECISAYIMSGVVLPLIIDRPNKNLKNNSGDYVLPENEFPLEFIVTHNTSSIKLNNSFSHGLYSVDLYKLNELYIQFQFNQDKEFTLYDCDNNVIFNKTSGLGWKKLHLKHLGTSGWLIEEITQFN